MSVNVPLVQLFRDGVVIAPHVGVAILQQLLTEAIQQQDERQNPDTSSADKPHLPPRIDDIELTSDGLVRRRLSSPPPTVAEMAVLLAAVLDQRWAVVPDDLKSVIARGLQDVGSDLGRFSASLRTFERSDARPEIVAVAGPATGRLVRKRWTDQILFDRKSRRRPPTGNGLHARDGGQRPRLFRSARLLRSDRFCWRSAR